MSSGGAGATSTGGRPCSYRGLHHRQRRLGAGSARPEDAVAPPFGFDWTSAKGGGHLCPTGPGVTPAWFVEDPQDLRITLSVNGVVKQDSSTSDMMTSAFAVVAAASRIMTLEPGDIVATGSPAGVGAPRGEFLQPGDDVVDGDRRTRPPPQPGVDGAPRVSVLRRHTRRGSHERRLRRQARLRHRGGGRHRPAPVRWRSPLAGRRSWSATWSIPRTPPRRSNAQGAKAMAVQLDVADGAAVQRRGRQRP